MAFDENTKLKELSNNEQAKDILAKYLPGIWTNPQTKMAMGFSLKAMSKFPQAGITPEKLQEIVGELATIE